MRFLTEAVLLTISDLMLQSVYFLALKLALSLILITKGGRTLGEVLVSLRS